MLLYSRFGQHWPSFTEDSASSGSDIRRSRAPAVVVRCQSSSGCAPESELCPTRYGKTNLGLAVDAETAGYLPLLGAAMKLCIGNGWMGSRPASFGAASLGDYGYISA